MEQNMKGVFVAARESSFKNADTQRWNFYENFTVNFPFEIPGFFCAACTHSDLFYIVVLAVENVGGEAIFSFVWWSKQIY